MKFGSLFAGIGGFDLGLERAGFECRFQVEIDDYANKVLEKHWPNVKRHRDIRSKLELEPVDLICGGFPCQDISSVGKRAGITGARSGLWGEMVKAICLVRPKYVFVENVAALLVRGMGRVLGDLAAGGFDSEWDCLPAAAFGAPHRRDRVWIVANANSKRGWQEQISKRRSSDTPKLGDDGEKAALADSNINRCEGKNPFLKGGSSTPRGRQTCDTTIKRLSNGSIFEVGRSKEKPKLERSDWWTVEPNVGRVAHGVPKRVDRLKCLGNAVVPQIVTWIGRRIIEFQNSREG